MSALPPCTHTNIFGCLGDLEKSCSFQFTQMSQARNPTGYPHHHQDCRVIHSVRTHPCFPLRNDAHTKLQKKWIEENKENIPPPNLRREEAFSHPKKYSCWKKQDEPEAIEEDDSESDSEEEEGHNGTQHRLPTRSVNSSSNRTGNTSKQ